MRMTEIDRAASSFELDAGPQHASPLGTVHGGILCDLADAALGCAHASLLEEGETFATVELKINFLKPVWAGRLTAVGTVVKAGRTIGLTECRVTDEARLARRLRDLDLHDLARRGCEGAPNS